LVGELSLSEAINVDFQKLIPNQTVNLLAAPESKEESKSTALVEQKSLPIIGNTYQVSILNKVEMRKAHDALKIKEAELEAMRYQMREAIGVLKKELDKKIKAIYMIETYMGINEEVIQLSTGTDAPEEIPLALYQQKLYMDEEIGIWSNGGIDYKDIDQWDEWIKDNYATFLYEPKSICAFQVRRTEKGYSDNALVNAIMNESNFKTYFLIRNGTNLYRIWSNVYIDDRMFPAETEYQDIVKRFTDDDYSQRTTKENLEVRHQQYLYGVIAIQGLIERTNIFGTALRSKVNLMKLNEESIKYIKFVRDDEQNNWLTSGEPSWYDFLKANQLTVQKGSRIVIMPKIGWSSSKDDQWRTEPFRPGSWPSYRCLHTIEEEGDKTYHGWKFLIRYSSEDDIWTKDFYGRYSSHTRTKRVPFRLYTSEVMNFDEITVENCDYYRKNRNDRKHYIDMLPVLHWIIEIKKEEKALEEEFVKFLAGQLCWDENRYQEIREAIKWWKLKNKWKRAVTKDEAKAVRMILNRLKKG
jgi:hypothetical protein